MISRFKVILIGVFYLFMGILSSLNLYFLTKRIYKIALKLCPSRRTEWIVDLGFEYEMSGNLEKAEEYYKEAITLEPEDAFHYVEIGNIYEKQNKTILAIENYEKALQLGDDLGDRFKNEFRLRIKRLKDSIGQ